MKAQTVLFLVTVFPQASYLPFTLYLKLSCRCSPPTAGECLAASYASSKQVSFRQLLPWAGLAKNRNNFQSLGSCTRANLGRTVERMSSSLLRDPDKNNKRYIKCLRLTRLLFQTPEWYLILKFCRKGKEHEKLGF